MRQTINKENGTIQNSQGTLLPPKYKPVTVFDSQQNPKTKENAP